VGWGTLSVLLGYLGGSNWRHVEQLASHVGLGALAATFAVVAWIILLRRRRSRAEAPSRLSDSARHEARRAVLSAPASSGSRDGRAP
jgi:hypothetical protein